MQVALDDSFWEGVDAGIEALVERWLVAEGDRVSGGQPIVEVVIVKASHEIVSPADGILTQILVPADGTFRRGASLGVIRPDGTA